MECESKRNKAYASGDCLKQNKSASPKKLNNGVEINANIAPLA